MKKIEQDFNKVISDFVLDEALRAGRKVKEEKDKLKKHKCRKSLEDAIKEAEEAKDRMEWYMEEGRWEHGGGQETS